MSVVGAVSLVTDAVAGGFFLATRNLHLVLADMAAKLAWLLLTFLFLLFSATIFLPLPTSGGERAPQLGTLLFGVRVATFWPQFLENLIIAGVLSFLTWGLLEAFVRSRILYWIWHGFPERKRTFARFLASGMLRRLIFGLVAALLILILMGPGLATSRGEWTRTWPEMQWAVLTVVLLLTMVAFVLMVVDTLLRCDAVETLGPQLGGITAAVALIGLFEVILRLAALAGTVVLLNLIAVPVVLLFGVPAIGVTLSVVHSYLLLVRYCAIGIMRTYYVESAPAHGAS